MRRMVRGGRRLGAGGKYSIWQIQKAKLFDEKKQIQETSFKECCRTLEGAKEEVRKN